MLDPRIYRTGLIAVLLGAILLAFSLYDEQGGVGTNLAPDGFNGQNAYSTMQNLAQQYPDRAPGGANDEDIAAIVSQGLSKYGFIVSREAFKARTAAGSRTLENVVGVRAGVRSGSIVVVAQRDALGSPSGAQLSGTAVLLELARALSGETQNRSVVLVSTSGSAGASGTTEVARTLPGPIDAVVVLGDLASTGTRNPVVVPWTNAQLLAPTMLRNTVAGALTTEAGFGPGEEGLLGQFAHLAFPMSPGQQGPFGARGLPAVMLSLAGERVPGSEAQTSLGAITAMGRTVLRTVTALDGGPSAPAPSAYLLFDDKVVPLWAIRLFVLALMLPVLLASLDGLARARRRHQSVVRGMIWVLSTGLPFVLAGLAVLVLRLTGLISAAPPAPVLSGAIPLHGSGIAALAIVAVTLLVGMAVLRPLVLRFAAGRGDVAPMGAGAGLLVVLSVVAVAVWVGNPFAAALLVPALHLWLWVVDPEIQLRKALLATLVVLGAALPVLAVLYYALSLGLGPLGTLWNGTLLIAGGVVRIMSVIEWGIFAGCGICVALIALRHARQPRLEDVAVTVRGPVTYAGPGSLGGTESALRR